MIMQDVIRLDLPAQHKYLNILGACLNAFLERLDEPAAGLPEGTGASSISYNITLAAHEVCTNAVEHAYAGVTDGRIGIIIEVIGTPRRLVVEVHDTGRTFDPSLVPQPNLGEGQVHGYGLYLVHQLTSEATYRTQSDGNYWRLVWDL